MMYSLYNTALLAASMTTGRLIWFITSAVIAVAGTVLVLVLFLTKKNEGKFKGFLGWLYDFLNFKNLVIEIILKATYISLAIFITLYSFSFISLNFWLFIEWLIFGNLGLRIAYELLTLFITLCKNISEINKKMK